MLWVTATSAIILMIDVKQIYEPNSLSEYWQEKGVTTLRGCVTGTPQPHYFYAVLLIPYLLKRNLPACIMPDFYMFPLKIIEKNGDIFSVCSTDKGLIT